MTTLQQLDAITALLQLVDKLSTSLLRTHLVDKLRDFYVCTHVKTHKLLQVCKQVVTNLLESCVRTACSQVVVTSLEQAVNNL